MQLNPRYAPQLESVLTWPQSIGLVGGRPSSSLYFVGWQAAPAHPQEHQQQRRQQQHAAHADRSGQQLEGHPGAVPGAGEPAPAAAAAAEQPQRAQQPVLHPKQQAAAGQDLPAAPAGRAAGSSIIYLDPHQVQEVRRVW